jgi:hypothetical protein
MTKRIILVILRILSLFICSLFLISCDTVLSQDQMNNKYKGSDIKTFVKDRYTMSSSFAKVNKVFGYLDKVSSAPPPKTIDDFTYKILPDGKSVLFPLSFNDFNYHFIYKPSTEAQEFCKMQDGKLFIDKIYNINFQGLKESPLVNSIRAYESHDFSYSVSYDDIGSLFTGSTQSFTVDKSENQWSAAQAAVINAEMVNHSGLSVIYQNAIKKGAFGLYSCRSSKAMHTVLWKIRVIPVYYKVDSPHDHDIYVLITPYEKTSSKYTTKHPTHHL